MNAHPLVQVFDAALEQVQAGKGIERHGQDAAGERVEFMQQDWRSIANAHGAGFLTGQAEKKLRESIHLKGDARRRERLGAMVYIAMAILFEEGQT